MDTCKNCGKPLENPDQELCPACRAVENAKARTRREEKAGHARRRRMNRTTRKMLIAVCVLAVVFIGLCVTATVMYDKYNPDEFIASVDAALEAGDARALKNLLKGEDLTVSDEGAAALCRGLWNGGAFEAESWRMGRGKDGWTDASSLLSLIGPASGLGVPLQQQAAEELGLVALFVHHIGVVELISQVAEHGIHILLPQRRALDLLLVGQLPLLRELGKLVDAVNLLLFHLASP